MNTKTFNIEYNGYWIDKDDNIRDKDGNIIGHVDIVPVEEDSNE